MKRPIRLRSTRLAAAAVVALAATACAALVEPLRVDDSLTPLDLALSEPPSAIQHRAETGDGFAAAAWSIVLEHGLNGVAVDPASAQRWRQRALAIRRVMPITQYTAAFRGQPSRVNVINVPVAVVSPRQFEMIDLCIVALRTETPVAPGCAFDGPDMRLARWRQAQP